MTPNDVTRLILAMQEAGKSESTIRNAYTTLRKSLDDAVTNGLLRANPVCTRSSSPASGVPRPGSLSPMK